MTVPETIYSRVKSAGFTTEAACALLAQIRKESLFKPENLEDSRNRSLGMTDWQYVNAVDSGSYTNFVNDAAGFGLAQWTEKSRKQNFINYFRSRGKSIADLETQISFLIYEMKAFFGGIWNQCLISHDLKNLTWILLNTWENPQEKEQNMIERFGYAQEYYRLYSNQNDKEVSTMTKEQAIQKVLDLARSEIGYHEKASNSSLDDKSGNSGSGNYTKYARDLDKTNWYNGGKNGYAWCDVFVDWLFYKCFGDPLGRTMICQPTGSAGAGCLYSAQYYKSAGCWHSAAPQPGDQIFFTYSAGEYSHTGIVETVNGITITTIEGNTSDMVGRRTYQTNSPTIAGYGRPKWELVENVNSSTLPSTSSSETTESESYHELLNQGSTGASVMELQKKLIELGFSVGPDGADGDFGVNTYYAVRRFQIENDLEIDGIVGNETWNAIEAALKKKNSTVTAEPKIEEISTNTDEQKPVEMQNEDTPASKPYLELPMISESMEDIEGPYVKLAQAAMACWGYTIVIHGIFGKEMTTKVKDFQQKKGLESDGIIGPETWKALLKII